MRHTALWPDGPDRTGLQVARRSMLIVNELGYEVRLEVALETV